jgi:DNA-binding SARP family transcriptional activator
MMADPASSLLTMGCIAEEGDPLYTLPGSWLPTAEATNLRPVACQLQILGDFSLTINERQIEVGSGIMEMLALLGVAGRLSRERVRAVLWPSADPILTASRLRSLIYRLRRACDGHVIVSGPSAIIGLNPEIAVDYQIAAAAASRMMQQHTMPAIALTEAASLLASELLPFHSWDWLALHQHAWSRTRLRALEACARQALRIGDLETAIVACERVILAEPFHEQGHYLMIVALLQEGYDQTARIIYSELRARLADELRCVPKRTYRELRDAASRQAVSSRMTVSRG